MAFSFKSPLRNLMHRIHLGNVRRYSDQEGPVAKKGLILGVYTDPETREHKLTPAAEQFNNSIGRKLEEVLRSGELLTIGKANIYQNLDHEFYSIAVVGLGSEDTGFNPIENLDMCNENVRIAAGAAATKMQRNGVSSISIDGMGNPEAAAEGAGLALWKFQGLKSNQEIIPSLELFSEDDKEAFQRGLLKAEAQNFARRLSESPANIMTPAIFAQQTVNQLCPCGVNVEVRDKEWIIRRKMFSFLAVAKGSIEQPVFLEIGYCGGQPDEKPIVFIGKGITYDTGGLCLKKCGVMPDFRADMSGAAVIVATMRAAASLSLPINLQAVIPLCENMPSGMAMKPGDVVRCISGKTIQIDHTDCEGRLLLADGLIYAQNTLKPRMMIDIGTLTTGMKAALGNAASGVFTNSTSLWLQLDKAGSITGDRVWRFPLWEHFTTKVTGLSSADVSNLGWGPGGNPCRAAAFLKEFIHCGDWIHLDIASAGIKADTDEFPYLAPRRMTGRPTRTIIQFLYQLACPSKDSACSK